MDQKEKILQIAGGGDVLYALSSEGGLYIGRQHERGFEWRRLPEMNFESMRSVTSLASAGDEGTQPVLSAPEGVEINVQREEVKPEVPKPVQAK